MFCFERTNESNMWKPFVKNLLNYLGKYWVGRQHLRCKKLSLFLIENSLANNLEVEQGKFICAKIINLVLPQKNFLTKINVITLNKRRKNKTAYLKERVKGLDKRKEEDKSERRRCTGQVEEKNKRKLMSSVQNHLGHLEIVLYDFVGQHTFT